MSNDKKFALISVSDKTNLEDIAHFLSKNGFSIVSTGGTYKKLKELNIDVISISDITNFPEIMDGRVKTLHPNIHAGLLARKSDNNTLEKLKIDRISVLIVNFYPFEDVISNINVKFKEAIENIDIGGPTMVRAAAKNFELCTVLTKVESYDEFIEKFDPELKNNEELNRKMALIAFEHVAHYDICIANYLSKKIKGEKFEKFYSLKKISDLRYGENPHQEASLFQDMKRKKVTSITNSKQHQGKELSYNNIVDGDAALSCVINFNKPSCVIVKHANPCGVASTDNNIETAYLNAYSTDPVSAFGGVIAFNKEVTYELVKKILEKQFVEIIIAPKFSGEAIIYAKTKQNIRIIEYQEFSKKNNQNLNQIKTISDGILIQQEDL